MSAKNKPFCLGSFPDIVDFAEVALGYRRTVVPPKALKLIASRRASLEALLAGDTVMYGINTGFGELASQRVSRESLKSLQVNLIRSHACGVGEPLDDAEACGLMFARANELAMGNSGVRPVLVKMLSALINKGVIPFIPSKGSVGASGDLAPSAHMALTLIGEGMAKFSGEDTWQPSAAVLKKAGIKPIELAEKEGLALINGTQAMKSVGGLALFEAMNLFSSAVLTGAMTLEALKGTPAPFDTRIQELKPHAGQLEVAEMLQALLKGSKIRASHSVNDKRVQDPYSLRCMPQAMGASRDAIEYALNVFETELGSVTDNPLLVEGSKRGSVEVLSGGNFHGQAVAFAADFSAIAITAMGNMSERRIAQLVSDFKILPPFLARNPGLESGFMIAHVTAAALCNENKILSHPASADSISTSANKEDFVSMGMTAALKLSTVVLNVARITAIELMAAAEGIEFHRPLKSSARIEKALAKLRGISPAFKGDEVFSGRIEAVAEAILSGYFVD
ncbi:MAG: histidine ammonia-lyase [Elusimicrobia bacterium CG1_02_56_21]|nr:MAG: histidine ammonia-lyase [Elusimicrobia bacterium CG1_02_56_21]